MSYRNINGQQYGVLPGPKEEKTKGDGRIKRDSLFDCLVADILGQGSYLRFCARGNSMTPFIRNGDIILVEPKEANKLRIGDIVFYHHARGGHVAHRLISKRGNDGSLVLTTRGDNLRHPDAPVFSGQVLGRVIRIEGQGKELRINGRVGQALNRLLLWLWLNVRCIVARSNQALVAISEEA